MTVHLCVRNNQRHEAEKVQSVNENCSAAAWAHHSSLPPLHFQPPLPPQPSPPLSRHYISWCSNRPHYPPSRRCEGTHKEHVIKSHKAGWNKALAWRQRLCWSRHSPLITKSTAQDFCSALIIHTASKKAFVHQYLETRFLSNDSLAFHFFSIRTPQTNKQKTWNKKVLWGEAHIVY